MGTHLNRREVVMTWQDMNAIPGTSSETVGSDLLENQGSYEDLQRQLAEIKQLLKESKAKIVQLPMWDPKVGFWNGILGGIPGGILENYWKSHNLEIS